MLNPPSSSGTDACLFWLAETVRRATITVRLRLRLYSDGTTTTNRLYDGDSMSDHDTTRHDTTRHDNDTTRHDNNDDATTTRHDTTTTTTTRHDNDTTRHDNDTITLWVALCHSPGSGSSLCRLLSSLSVGLLFVTGPLVLASCLLRGAACRRKLCIYAFLLAGIRGAILPYSTSACLHTSSSWPSSRYPACSRCIFPHAVLLSHP